MRLEHYKPAKNNLLLKEVVIGNKGNIILKDEVTAGYFEVIKAGPLCENTKPGDYIITTLQQGTGVSFEEGSYIQLPEFGVEGYYSPTKQELETPVPIFTSSYDEDEELNVIDSEGGDNELGEEFGLREN